MAISNLTPVEPWPSRKLPQDKFDASVKTAMDQMSVMVGELNDSFIPAANEAVDTVNTLTPDIPAILDAPKQAAASAESAAGSAGAAAESVSAAAQEVEKAKTEADRAKAEADRAKESADNAAAIAGVGPATVEKLGLVKPDGTTTQTTEYGTLSVLTFGGSAAGLVPAATPEDAQKVLLGNGTWGSGHDGAAAMTISEDLHLTADSPRTLVLTASVPNLSVHLPAPSTLPDGATFHIIVRPMEAIQLCDSSGQPIKAHPILSIFTAIRVQLVDSASGLWALSKYENGSTSDAQREPGLNIGELTVFNSADTSSISVTALSESKAIVCYSDAGNSRYGTACVLSISGTTVTAGSEKVFNSASTSDISVTALSESKAIVCYSDRGNSTYGTACVLSISGTTVTAGSEKVFSSEDAYSISVTALSESKAIVCYSDRGNSTYGTACVLSISGTTVAAGSDTVFNSASTSYISVTALSESKAIVCYSDSGNSRYGTACVLSISGTTVTAGSETVFNSADTSYISVTALSESKAIVCYSDAGNFRYGTACVLSISGTTVAAGSDTVFNSASTSYISVTALSGSTALVCFINTEYQSSTAIYRVKAKIISIFENIISIQSESELDFNETNYISVDAIPLSEGKAVAAFFDSSNSVGKSCVLSIV